MATVAFVSRLIRKLVSCSSAWLLTSLTLAKIASVSGVFLRFGLLDCPQTIAQPIEHGADSADRRQLPFPVAFRSKQCLAYSLGGDACVGQGRFHLRVCLTVCINQRADITL